MPRWSRLASLLGSMMVGVALAPGAAVGHFQVGYDALGTDAGQGRVKVYSGNLLVGFQPYGFASGSGDIDGDGWSDVITAPSPVTEPKRAIGITEIAGAVRH